MNNNDFMLPRNSGTSPVKLLFDKSLMLAKRELSMLLLHLISSHI